jgi:hypothetical protein
MNAQATLQAHRKAKATSPRPAAVSTPLQNYAASRVQAVIAEAIAKLPRTNLQEEIACEVYFTAAHGTKGVGLAIEESLKNHLQRITFCVITLRNGFVLTGRSVCSPADKYDAKLGRELARKDAARQAGAFFEFQYHQDILDMGALLAYDAAAHEVGL